jgi:hypothetical protein
MWKYETKLIKRTKSSNRAHPPAGLLSLMPHYLAVVCTGTLGPLLGLNEDSTCRVWCASHSAGQICIRVTTARPRGLGHAISV